MCKCSLYTFHEFTSFIKLFNGVLKNWKEDLGKCIFCLSCILTCNVLLLPLWKCNPRTEIRLQQLCAKVAQPRGRLLQPADLHFSNCNAATFKVANKRWHCNQPWRRLWTLAQEVYNNYQIFWASSERLAVWWENMFIFCFFSYFFLLSLLSCIISFLICDVIK